MAQYQPGQRWISDSEAELGLGTILAQDGRLLTVLYPATGDTRQYALRNAPLTRVRFAPGDEVTHFEGWKMTVREVEESEGLLVYHGLTAQNEQRTLPETQLSNFIQFRLASDRLFAGQIDPLPWFSLRYHTLERRSQLLQSSLWGLGGARAQPIAHQLHIAREVADRMAPRVLLADEVGLGKTIEAGLIIHRQLLSGRAGRVLILVPENLQHQWLVEMRRRFNLLLLGFILLRLLNGYGEKPWAFGETPAITLMGFFNVTKYPPSLLFLALTLGIGLLLLAWFERLDWSGRGKALVAFGGAPMFFYLLHLYLLKLLYLLALAIWGANRGDYFGFSSVPALWLCSILLAVTLYPAVHWFAGFKARRRDIAWLKYF